MMKYKDTQRHDPLAQILRESCPEPLRGDDFSQRVVSRIRRERQQAEAARQYWEQHTGMPRPKGVVLLNVLLSPLLVFVVLVIAGIIFRRDICALAARSASIFVTACDVLAGISPVLIPVAGCLIMLTVLSITFAVLGRR